VRRVGGEGRRAMNAGAPRYRGATGRIVQAVGCNRRDTWRMPPSDHAMVTVVRTNSHAPEFAELYRRHTPMLERRVRRILGTYDGDVDDIVQESWLRALRSLHQWRGTGSFSTWLCIIGTRAALNAIRRRRRLVEMVDDMAFDDPGHSTDHIDIDRAAAHLSPRRREVFELYDALGFSHREIGQRLGIREGTSKTALFHARGALRKHL
jgi:RNA polymerase sigma factor (sigma-70 family)